MPVAPKRLLQHGCSPSRFGSPAISSCIDGARPADRSPNTTRVSEGVDAGGLPCQRSWTLRRAGEIRVEERSVALVTGGGTGIGAASALELSAAGWSVAVCGRRQDRLEEVVAQCSGEAFAFVADVSQPADVDRLFDAVMDRFGRLDLLFNNAGAGSKPAPIDELPVEDWLRVVGANLTGSWLCARAAFAQMKRQDPPGGRIINNGSISAQAPRPFSSPYTATKHAVTGLTKALSLEGRPHGICVGQIDIGNARTPMTARIEAGVPQADGSVRPEPVMDVADVSRAVRYMAELPPDSNVLQMTVMANSMPFVGRG
ncbi:MAG: SDR family oxidoreductase [Acidimicrobiia bacterium]|nr:SDR family oxidoreductase [Acidimicrobiia bacterium]MYB24511.1 SDR family oxidoreductase [Acidimicrobiia bacterium]MYE68366.1 SDR family oxidoreductase [Acidimicrobiia bacterium]